VHGRRQRLGLSVRRSHPTALALWILGGLTTQEADAAWAQAATGNRFLAVGLEKQLGAQWCWAATGSLILDWLDEGSGPSQCTVAACSYPGLDCKHPDCQDLAGGWTGECDKSGVPDFAGLGWPSLETQPGQALPWQRVRCEIDSGRPIAFGWWHTSRLELGPGHMMAVAGYGEFLGGSAVAVADPLGPMTRVLSYDYWVASEDHWHGQDWYGFHRATSPPPTDCDALPSSVPTAPNFYESAAEASQTIPVELAAAGNEGLRTFLELPAEGHSSEALCLEERVGHARVAPASVAISSAIRLGPFALEPLLRWTYPCLIGSSPFDLVLREGERTEWLEIRGLHAAQAHARARVALATDSPSIELVEFVLPGLHVSFLLRRGPEATQLVVPVEGIPGVLEAGKPLKIGELVESLAASPFAAELGLVLTPP